LASARDPDELSRVEFEPDHIAVISKRPKHYSAEDNFLFRVSSMGLYLFEDRLIAVLSDDVSIFDRGKDMSHITGGLRELLIRLLVRSVSQFLSHIRTITMLVQELEDKLKKTVDNKYLLNMFKLNQSMTYYMSALSANSALIDRLRGYSAKIGFTAEHNELLEDLSVDNAQCYKQAEIYSDILGGLMDARTGVINNNLNLLMKRLTILTVIFMPLNVIAGFFGMSEFTELVKGFYKSGEISHLVFCVSWSLAAVALVGIGFLTFWLLKWFKLD
jgi:magnesium transporter